LFTLCAIPQLRWEIMNFDSEAYDNGDLSWAAYHFINFTIFYGALVILLVLSLFIDKPPKHSAYAKSANPNPEITSSIFNKLFFFWFDPTAWKGWRRPLIETDIFDINPENTSRELVPEFDQAFQRNVEKNKR